MISVLQIYFNAAGFYGDANFIIKYLRNNSEDWI